MKEETSNTDKTKAINYEPVLCDILSPLQKQINDIKLKHDNPVVWFEINGFYEAIGEDAVITDAVLGNGLTQREDGLEISGFDANMLEKYVPLMIKHGNRVALVNVT